MKKQTEDKPTASYYSRLEEFLSRHHQVLFYWSLALMALFSLFLFNLRISEGGDDSAYITRAMDLLDSGRYPSYQGPLYPMFLAIVLSITGFNLFLFKCTSLIFMLMGQWLLYRTFRNRIAWVVLFAALFLTSVNSWYLFFASQTYSEAMFIFIQNVFLFVMIHFYTKKTTDEGSFEWKLPLIAAAIIVMAFLIRSAGFGLAIAAVVFLLSYKKYKKAVILVVLFLSMAGSWMVVRNAVWPTIPNKGKQLKELMQKHPYDTAEGEETVAGFFQRFADNSNLYLSKHFVKMIGFRGHDSKTTSGLISLLLYALFIYGVVMAYRNHPPLFLVGIYLSVMLGITFFSVQKLWDQYRLIIPYFPLMILFLLYSLVQLVARKNQGRRLGWILVLVALCFSLSAVHALHQVDTKVLMSNVRGNKYEGYTPDWQNFLKMSEYVGKNMTDTDLVACRKPDMARLSADGKKFYGIFRFDSEDPDVLLNELQNRGITHILIASLRKNPAENNGEVINTLHRYMAFILQKYPGAFVLVHQIGEDEPAWLFKVSYPQTEQPIEVNQLNTAQ